MRFRSDTSMLFVLALVIIAYATISNAVQNMRMHNLGYICAEKGEQLIDFNMGGPAKCWNPETTLMHEPEELLKKR